MKKYAVVFVNETLKEITTIFFWKRDRFTHREYKIVVSELFEQSAFYGINGKKIVANVYNAELYDDKDVDGFSHLVYDEKEVLFRVSIESHVDGSTVISNLNVNGKYVKSMVIAD